MTFQAFVEKHGVIGLAKKLGVTKQAVSLWYCTKQAPNPRYAYKMVKMSKGTLSWEDIYVPVVERQLAIEKRFGVKRYLVK